MSALTVRLSDQIFDEVNTIAKKLHISRSEYIRQSIEQMNRSIYEQEKKNKLISASKRVRQESIIINSEFSKIEYDPEA